MQQLLSILFLIAASQAVFLAVFLLHKHRWLYANRFFAVLILVYAIILIDMLLQDEGMYVEMPWLLLLMSGMPLIIGPLHYLYARHLVMPAQRFHRKDWLHFLPLLLYKLSLLPFFFALIQD